MTFLALTLSIALFALLLIPVRIIYQDRDIDFLDPIFFVIASVTIGTLIRGVYLTTLNNNELTKYISNLEISNILSGYTFIYISLLFFTLGYSVDQRKLQIFNKILAKENWAGSNVKLSCFALVTVAIVFWWLFINSIDLKSVAISALSQKRAILDENGKKIAIGYFRWGASLTTIAYYVALIYISKKPQITTKNKAILCLFFLGAIAFPVFTSIRIEVISTFVNTIVILHFIRAKENRTFSAKSIWILVGAVMTLAILVSVLSSLRKGEIENKSVNELASLNKVVSSIVGNQNFYGIGKSTVAFVHNKEKLYGKSIVSILTAAVPRQIWPEKPEVGMSYYFGSKYYLIDYRGNKGGGTPPGISVELFLNFGLLGTIIGMWFYGFFLRTYYIAISDYLYARNSSALLIHISILIPMTLYITSNDIAQALIATLTLLIPSLILIKFFQRQKSPKLC